MHSKTFPRLVILCVLSLFLATCSGDGDSSDPAVNLPVCGNVSSFTAVQDHQYVDISVSGTNEPLNYEISVVAAVSGQPNPDYGTIRPFVETQHRFDANDLNVFVGQTYYVYVRSACTDTSRSAWTAAQTLTFQDYCTGPEDLVFTSYSDGWGFGWHYGDDRTSHYQVSYGLAGTAAGSGIIVQTSDDHITPALSAGNTYDFYVRSFCSGGTGWSAWSGPYTYFAETNLNLCTQPSNVQYTQLSSSQANFTWDYNGETQFEYALLTSSQNINTASLYTIGTAGTPTFTGMSNAVTYTFYVRAICTDGSRTPWTTRLVDLN